MYANASSLKLNFRQLPKVNCQSQYCQIHVSPFYEPVYTITFTVTNTGSVDGSEVAQLYLSFPEEAAEPPKILRGFERIYLETGESKTVTLPLTQRDISYWNVR
jgi:beta-glucosidase